MTVKGIANRILGLWGYYLAHETLYLKPKEVVPQARARNMTLCEYLDKSSLFPGMLKIREMVLDNLEKALPPSLPNVLEIGSGTGMYVEKIVERYSPASYEVYEISKLWSAYLKETYSEKTRLLCHDADGKTLRHTASGTIDAAFAHGIFVYVPLITSIGYLEEMVRVTKPGGWIIFDCHLSRDFDLETIKQWQEDPRQFDFAVVISEELLEKFMAKHGLVCVAKFNSACSASFATYFILQRAG